jgi:hypothetical protein
MFGLLTVVRADVVVGSEVSQRVIVPVGPPDLDTTGKSHLLETDTTMYFGYLIMWVALTDGDRGAIEERASVKFVDTTENRYINLIMYRTHVNFPRRALYDGFGTLYNVIPMIPEDKLTKKIYDGEGFVAGCEQDSVTGLVWATVKFFSIFPEALCDSLVASFADTVLSKAEANAYMVMAEPESLLAMTQLTELQQVSETNSPSCPIQARYRPRFPGRTVALSPGPTLFVFDLLGRRVPAAPERARLLSADGIFIFPGDRSVPGARRVRIRGN